MRYGDKWPTLAKEWDRMVIKDSRVAEMNKIAKFVISHKSRYEAIEKATGVPWPLIAVLHQRESSGNFNTYLGNGQPLNRVTTIVPKGRGPWKTFEEGAIDALNYDGLAKVKDWRLEKILWHAEKYNGLGYEMKGLPSPYVWGGTNIQKAGKYIADGKFSPTTWDGQPGVAPIIKSIANLDPDIAVAPFMERET